MDSHEELLGMIASEVAEGYTSQQRGVARQGRLDDGQSPLPTYKGRREEGSSINYRTRLVRKPNGTLEWEE